MAVLQVGLLLVASLAAGCTSRPTGDGGEVDGSPDAVAPDVLADAGVEGAWDASVRSGPATFVSTEVSLTLDRLCDFDGDGVGDNALADLGPTEGMIVVAAIDSFLNAFFEEGIRILLHSPWVDDMDTPYDDELQIILFDAADTDDPPDSDDDFDGDEPFYAKAESLDACGEPAGGFSSATLDESGFYADARALTIPTSVTPPIEMREARFFGRVDPDWTVAEADVCYSATASALAEAEPLEAWGGLNTLEFLVAGGEPLGYPTMPGAQLNVDVDGDGLERFETDDDGHITACIDGDDTVIPGADCWQDPRIADAVGLSMHLDFVSAVLAGREPGWEEEVEGECVDPPEASFWGESSDP